MLGSLGQTSGCVRRNLPGEVRVSMPAADHRFTAWTRAGLWPRLHRLVLDELGAHGQIDWMSTIVGAAVAKEGTPTDSDDGGEHLPSGV
ncbi:hypothetical protein EBO15_42005 [Actinomadura harenae]|uniref:Transposase n=1 Tax=Actinomadura harenae TaxID=2483351 RepID=A0A3M2L4C0_9ACTN|nr:hypothetical protein EBO15_42005 [Actinomadura harenae]